MPTDHVRLTATCPSQHPKTGEPCAWPEGHGEAVVDPAATKDGRGPLVEHSWALTGITWVLPPQLGDVRFLSQWSACAEEDTYAN